jgi:N-acetylglucosaminyldiphosphoundecaprenol N-acetyl-beta-D-mannosaminyltransferase
MTHSTAPAELYAVCGVPIAAMGTSEAAERVLAAAISGETCQVHLCNAYTLSLVDGDPELARALLAADLNLPDGAPVAWLGRSAGVQGPVRGADLVREIVQRGQDGVTHYLYGGKEGVAEQMAEALRREVPGLRVVGTECPPFRPIDADEVRRLADRVRSSGAGVVWIGLGTPRQDYLVHQLAPLVDAALVPVGAAFDFWSGNVREAPRFLRGSGLEWVFRLASEPRRLWRRYLVGNPRFVLSAWRHRRR